MKKDKITSPPYLQKGDMIGITCPASKMERTAAEYGCEVLESRGFKVRMGNTVGSQFHNFSATDEERYSELQRMLDDESIKAILFGRGGYGILRILDQLDFTHFQKKPKWICGYSDITALHLHVLKHCHVQTLHSLMCGGIADNTKNDPYVNSLFHVLEGKECQYDFSTSKLNRKGITRGILTGGNLCLLAALCGSSSQPDMQGKILFIEDIGEYKYSIDRMMLTLKRAGWLDHLQGLVVGAFTESKDTDEPFGQSEWELIYDKVKEYNYPIAFGFPVGHQKENYALKEGAVYQLEVGEKCSLKDKDINNK